MNIASPRTADGIGSSDRTRYVLALAFAIPVIYFGIQFAAAPFYPGYSFFSRDASSLGSDASTAPWIFNLGTLALGIVQVAVGGTLFFALPRARVGRALAALTAFALGSSGIGSLNAFLHPLPSRQHTEGLLFSLGSGVMLLPVLTTIVLWRLGARRYAVATAIVFLSLIPLMTGLVQRICMQAGIDLGGYQFFLNNYHGLIQRLGAAAIFLPIATIAHLLRSRSYPGHAIRHLR
jgi:hypothetical membrane protein